MKLKVQYSIEFDKFNYMERLFDRDDVTHGLDLKKRILDSLEDSLRQQIETAKSEVEFETAVYSYLQSYSEQKAKYIDRKVKDLEELWVLAGNQIIYELERLYNKPFPHDEITMRLTTLSVCPYNTKEKYFYVALKQFSLLQLRTATHELNHFMFHHYFKDLYEKLGNEKFHLLKESLTFFTNPEKIGYPNEKPLRKLYLSKKWKDIGEAVDAGVRLLSSK